MIVEKLKRIFYVKTIASIKYNNPDELSFYFNIIKVTKLKKNYIKKCKLENNKNEKIKK